MRCVMAYCFASFAVILLTHEAVSPVRGQCTRQGCDNRDPLIGIVAEMIQQLRDDLFDVLDKKVRSIHEHLEHDGFVKHCQSFHEIINASFLEIKSQHDTINMSLQAIDRRLLEHDVYVKHGQSFHELLNASIQELKTTVLTGLQEVDRRRSDEHDIYIKQGLSNHELFNESFQKMKSQHLSINISLQAIDRRLLEQSVCITQGQSIHGLLNESFLEMKSQYGLLNGSFQSIKSQYNSVNLSLQAVDRRLMAQGQSIQQLINESAQQTKRQHDAVMQSLLNVSRRCHENDVYIKQVPNIHGILNESFQAIESQYDFVNLSLQAVDRRLQSYQIDIRNQTQQSWKLLNDIWDAVSPLRDCSDIKARNQTSNGVYKVCAEHLSNRRCANAYCDMKNGTSLVFQRRKDGSVDFNRTWAEYREGFGNPDGEFWLGNEMLHILTSKRKYKLRVDLEDWDGAKGYAEYANFSISSSANNYKLTVGNYSGNAGDSMNYHNGKQFSTIDADNDQYRGYNCPGMLGGAWWYDWCSHASLNSKYHNRNETVIRGNGGIHWYYWKNRYYYSLKAAEMKLVPVA